MSTKTGLPQTLVDSYEDEGYENRVLSPKEIEHLLVNHSADRSDLGDTNGWTLFDMLAFLGY